MESLPVGVPPIPTSPPYGARTTLSDGVAPASSKLPLAAVIAAANVEVAEPVTMSALVFRS